MRPGRRSTLAFLTGSSLAQSASLVLGAMLASRLLGPHGRGLMVLGASIASVVPLLACMGTGSQLRAQLPSTPDGLPRRRLVASYTWWAVAATVVACVLTLVVSAGSASFIDPGLAQPPFLLAVVAVTIGYTALTLFPDAWYAAGQFAAGSAWAGAMAAAGTVGMATAALVERTASLLLLGQGIGMVAVAALQANRLKGAGLLSLQAPGRREISQLLRSGSQALGLTLGLALALRADRYLLGAAAGAAAVGVYSLAATLSEAPRLLPTALGQIVYRETALGEFHRIQRQIRIAVLASATAGLAVAVGGWLLIVPVFGAEFVGARPLLLVLLVAEVVFAPYAIASRGLLGGGWMGTAGALGLIGGIVTITLFGITIPIWGSYGAAATCVAAYAGMSVAAAVLLRQRLKRLNAQLPSVQSLIPASVSRSADEEGHGYGRLGRDQQDAPAPLALADSLSSSSASAKPAMGARHRRSTAPTDEGPPAASESHTLPHEATP